MSTQPRYWKKLERHPLSAAYPDISGRAWTQFVEDVKEYGILNKRKIVLHEGKVIDGWQLYRACIEADKKPVFEELKLPSGLTADEWVKIQQENRRHESQEILERRATERRERVATARIAGQSTRTIAKQEGVSDTTIQRDIKEIASTAPPGAVEPPDGKIVGQDGKKRDATKSTPDPKDLWCDNCKRAGRSPAGCKACKAMRDSAKNKPPEREPGDDTEVENEEKKRPKNGQILYDWKGFEAVYGKLIREIDSLGRAYRANNGAKANELRAMLGNFKKEFKAWGETLRSARKG